MRKLLGGIMALGFAMVIMLAGTAIAEDATAAEGAAMAGDPANGEKLFGKKRCKTCHKMTAKKAVGPGLAGVTERRSEAWLTKWVADPQGTWEENDEETQALKTWKKSAAKAKKTSMKIPKLKESEIADLIAYLNKNDGK